MARMAWLPFDYRDFHDIPRAIVVVYSGDTFLLDCPFDHKKDEYSSQFAVYRLPMASVQKDSWEGLADHGVLLGHLATGAIQFDRTRRRMLDDAPLAAFAGRQPQGSPQAGSPQERG